MHRCSQLLQTLHIAWYVSVCVSVCLPLSLCCSHGWAVQKWLKRARCHLGRGGDSCGSKEPCTRWKSRSDESICSREGWQVSVAAIYQITLDTCWLLRQNLTSQMNSTQWLIAISWTLKQYVIMLLTQQFTKILCLQVIFYEQRNMVINISMMSDQLHSHCLKHMGDWDCRMCKILWIIECVFVCYIFLSYIYIYVLFIFSGLLCSFCGIWKHMNI